MQASFGEDTNNWAKSVYRTGRIARSKPIISVTDYSLFAIALRGVF
ncbi:hypothetical protein IQ249_07945 [Lusitaniella coriacea LEGE 07157]|uniref:Uncharacterized protein n=1 Tax=Lusitaniella coriacea LEGE 07157 TaxID=945747 RepID=A0A8J7DVJ4_9CYAN|nr:hypothetical protein [Lusitaniella coriacea]MBE9115822.1 hypothetical protein [Lusitaniella coriacea LEGE 07157]